MHFLNCIRLSFIVTLFCFLSGMIQAQDTIISINAAIQITKVLEINPKQVRYKKFDNPDGPVYVQDRRTISKIIYANGSVDTLSQKQTAPPKSNIPKTPLPEITSRYRNVFLLSVTDPFLGQISACYERKFTKGFYSFKIPISIGLGYNGIQDLIYADTYPINHNYENSGYYDRDKIFSAGINLNYFPGGQRRLTFGFGPELEFGMFYYQLQQVLTTNPYVYSISEEVGSYSTFQMSAVLDFNITDRLVVAVNLSTGLGISYQYFYSNSLNSEKYSSSSTFPVLKGGFSIGYKF